MVCLYNPDFKAPLNSVLSNDEYHSNGTEPILFNFPFNNLSSKVEYQVMGVIANRFQVFLCMLRHRPSYSIPGLNYR